MDSGKSKPTKEAEIVKENQDFPNVSAASQKVSNEKTLKKEIKKSSELNPDGETINKEQKSEK